jgi:hypothetical protein
MADVTETILHRGRLGSTGLRYVLFEASPIDTNDTVTIGELSAITAVACFRLDTGASITATSATNVVTVTQATLTDMPRKYASEKKTTTLEGKTEYQKLLMRQRRAERRKQGLCSACGQPKNMKQKLEFYEKTFGVFQYEVV